MRMENGRMETIGSVVLDYSRYPGEDFYCDGASEDELLSIVQSTEPARYPEIIREKHSWEVLYHLSDLRENIVEWLPMDKSMKVLEVGSGCGAITGSLARKAGSVTCVDLSRKRSLINAYRHKDCENITIHVGNFQDIEPELPDDYDYVCLIGVFEYGQSYIGGDTPFHDFYRIIKKHVKKNGRIVIAIENKMGLKYWAGCREDHLGTFFSGLEDYPDGGAVRTFTKGGLERILQECGETEYRFYYPYPDYKFMTMVYSDRYLPKVGELSNNLRNFDRDRMLLFDEKKVFDMLIRENLFPLYSNSYMVVTGPDPETVYSRFSNDRASHLCIRTDIGQDAFGKKYVRKFAASEAASEHIHELAENYRIFKARFAGSGLSVNRLEEKCTADGTAYAELEFLENAVTLEELLDECLQRKDAAGFWSLFDRYMKILEWKETEQPQDFDLIFPNICVQGDTWTMIDYEWTAEGMSAKEIAQRALGCYMLENSNRKNDPILKKVLERMEMDEEAIARVQKREFEFQQFVMREKEGQMRTAVTDVRHLIGNKAIPSQELFNFMQAIGQKKMQVFEDLGEGYSPENSYYIENGEMTDGWIRAEILCKPGVKGLRLDPLEEPCLVRIRNVSFGGRKLTEKQLKQVVVTNGEVLGPLAGVKGTLAEGQDAAAGPAEEPGMTTVLFMDNDPNINVRMDMLEMLDRKEVGSDGDPAAGGKSAGSALRQTADGAENGGALTGGMLIIEAQVARLSATMLTDLKARLTTRRKRFWFQK